MIVHKGTQALYTERLVLRRFTSEDADDMFNNWARDDRVTHFLSWKPHSSPSETKILFQHGKQPMQIQAPIIGQWNTTDT